MATWTQTNKSSNATWTKPDRTSTSWDNPQRAGQAGSYDLFLDTYDSIIDPLSSNPSTYDYDGTAASWTVATKN